MSNDCLISIIIPTYKDWERLKFCLDALNDQTLNSSFYEIIVVNNSSEKCPFEFNSNARIIQELKPGSYSARNAGISASNGEVIAFTDSDCIPDNSWLENALKYINKNADCSLLGGRVEIFNESDKSNIYHKYDMVFAFPQEEYIKKGFSVTANLFVKKNVLNKVGTFNDALKSGGDYEFCLRAKNKGFRLDYSKNVLVSHPSRQSLKELRKKAKRIAGGVAWKGGYVKSMLLALAYLRPPINAISTLCKSKQVSLGEGFKIILIRYYLRFVATGERINILNGKESNR